MEEKNCFRDTEPLFPEVYGGEELFYLLHLWAMGTPPDEELSTSSPVKLKLSRVLSLFSKYLEKWNRGGRGKLSLGWKNFPGGFGFVFRGVGEISPEEQKEIKTECAENGIGAEFSKEVLFRFPLYTLRQGEKVQSFCWNPQDGATGM